MLGRDAEILLGQRRDGAFQHGKRVARDLLRIKVQLLVRRNVLAAMQQQGGEQLCLAIVQVRRALGRLERGELFADVVAL